MLINFIDWKNDYEKKKSGWVAKWRQWANWWTAKSSLAWGFENQKEWDVFGERVGQGCTFLSGPHTVWGENNYRCNGLTFSLFIECSLPAREKKKERAK